MRTPALLSVLAVVICAVSTVAANELEPADRSVAEVIDHYIEARIAADNVPASAQASDGNLIRRLTLDLAGRIPTTAELLGYLASDSPAKRTELVDRLLASPDFVFHQRNELQTLLEHPDRRNDGEFRKYMSWAVEQNRSWDAMFRDMLAGDENDEYQKAALQFLKSRARELDDLTNDTAVLFFGVNVSCAKCHDHPLVEDWKQDHFYGMQSFFSRSYLTKKNELNEKLYGEVKFTTTAGVEKQAKFMFLTGAVVEDQTPELNDEQRKEQDKLVKDQQQNDKAEPISGPAFSPRAKLVDAALQDGNRSFFSKNIVNRIWQRMLGRGIVNPVDQIHSENPASHPELLEWLARDLVEHGYDLKRLIRGIALSAAYSRSSEWSSAAEPPGAQYFALAVPRPLSPRQYAASLLVASRNPPHWEQWLDKPADEWKRERESLENNANGWAGQFEIPGESFQIAVDEALFFSNNDRIQNDLLRDSGDRLVGYVKAMADPNDAFTAACLAVNSREPGDVEKQAILQYQSARSDERDAAMKQVIWALLTGPELRFNY